MTTTLVDIIANNLLALLPIKIIHPYERGVMFTFGHALTFRQWLAIKRGKEVTPGQLEPGLHFFFPYFQSITVVHVVPEVVNLPTQSLTTTDGHHISFSANIEFEVHDAFAMYCGVQDFQNSLVNLAMNHLAYRVREWSWAELLTGQKDLERSMKDTLTTRVKKWGVTILSVGITDMVETQTYRVYGDSTGTVFIR